MLYSHNDINYNNDDNLHIYHKTLVMNFRVWYFYVYLNNYLIESIFSCHISESIILEVVYNLYNTYKIKINIDMCASYFK